MRPRIAYRALVALLLVGSALRPDAAAAQGNLSTQGFGYPPGQLSTRALGTGGALAELDPASPLNPASLARFGTTTLFFQMEPEYRAVQTNGGTERTTVARYPLVIAAIPIGARWTLGISSSTLLDRTWATSTQSSQTIGADTVVTTNSFRSDGSINDVRVAVAFAPSAWLHFGLAGHAYAGSDRESIGRSFSDTLRFLPFSQQRTLSFGGGAVSGGVEFAAAKLAAATLSFRHGGRLHALAGDTSVASGGAPDRIGVSAAYLGIAGTMIAARTSLERWSSLGDFGGARAADAWDTAVGADVAGPRFGAERALMLRAGARWRTLPFLISGSKVSERSWTVGAGTAFADGRMSADVTGVRALRDAGIGVAERAWTLSVGLTVRP